MNKSQRPRHLLSLTDLSRGGIESILDRAGTLEPLGSKAPASLSGSIVGLLFFQPSTRAMFGFHAATLRLGGQAIHLQEAKFEPGMDRPESLADTVRAVSAYCDTLVVRHPIVDEALAAASASAVPVICAGFGHAHHPTQAMIDLFAIRRKFGRIEGLRIGIAGGIARSRSAHSLIQTLSLFPPAALRLMAPKEWSLPRESIPVPLAERTTCIDYLSAEGLDVLYMCGLPPVDGVRRLPAETRAKLRLDPEKAKALPDSSIVLCPLPRIDEIDPAMDEYPQAKYFQQSADGLYVRMAVLEHVMKR